MRVNIIMLLGFLLFVDCAWSGSNRSLVAPLRSSRNVFSSGGTQAQGQRTPSVVSDSAESSDASFSQPDLLADDHSSVKQPTGFFAKGAAFVAKIADRTSFEAAVVRARDTAAELSALNLELEVAKRSDAAQDLQDRLARKVAAVGNTAQQVHATLERAQSRLLADQSRELGTKQRATEKASSVLTSLASSIKKQSFLTSPSESTKKVVGQPKDQGQAHLMNLHKKKMARVAIAAKNVAIMGANKIWKSIADSRVGRFFKTPQRLADSVAILLLQEARKSDGSIENVEKALFDKMTQDLSPKNKDRLWKQSQKKMSKYRLPGSNYSLKGEVGNRVLDFLIDWQIMNDMGDWFRGTNTLGPIEAIFKFLVVVGRGVGEGAKAVLDFL